MKVTVKVGEVSVALDGLDLTHRQVRALLMDCAGISSTMTEEPDEAPLMGFTAHMERLPEELPCEPLGDDED